MDILFIIGGSVIGMVVGYFISKATLGKQHETERQQALSESKRILQDAQREAESIKKDKILEAKESFLQKKAEYDEFVNNKSRKLDEREKGIKDRDQKLRDEKQAFVKLEKEVNADKEKISGQREILAAKQQELDKLIDENRNKLEGIAKLTQSEAKEQLLASLKEEAKTESLSYIKDIMDEAKSKANKESKKIILQTIQRTAAEQAIENTVSVFQLESDDQKGQIIGREGRNIRALESATGVEIIVDDTPEAIIISGFDAVRREVARLSLQRLVTDGRIHPARIEEIVAKTRKQIDEQIQEIGDRTIIDLGIHGLHRELVKLIGKMRFRSSYGQNLLQHSREVANLCATMAAELGIKPALAKRAGLLHDIGKVSEDDPEASHALLGMALCEKYNEHPAVCNAVGAHHDEVEMTAIISPIVQACDAISGSRPGARRETLENYIQRIKELETLAGSYEGVQKAFAMQAGRELRVIVESEEVTDEQSDMLAFQISDKIQNEMVYPGQIKVTVIREKRAVGYAK